MKSEASPLLITPEYQALLRERYTRPHWGGGGYHHVRDMARFARQLGATRILDYGCGRGTFKKAFLALPDIPKNYDVREYDPGIIGKDARPAPADLVVCTDVMEHVEPKFLQPTLKFIRRLSIRGTYFIIAWSPSRTKLADGRNAHLIVQHPAWWLDVVENAGFNIIEFQVRKGLRLWCQR